MLHCTLNMPRGQTNKVNYNFKTDMLSLRDGSDIEASGSIKYRFIYSSSRRVTDKESR